MQHPLGLHLVVWLMECISSTYDNRCVSIAWVKLSAEIFIPLVKIQRLPFTIVIHMKQTNEEQINKLYLVGADAITFDYKSSVFRH